jgi:Ser/Thr protein kinase RdoA (MazF antagonist)
MPVKKKPISSSFFNFDERIIQIITNEYELEEIDSFCPILLDGNLASLLEVRSETSKKIVLETINESFFLKQVPWYCDDATLLSFSHRFQKELLVQSLPVARILQTKAQDTWVTIQGYKFVLFEYIQGQCYQGNPHQLRSSVQTLAQLHKFAQTYDIEEKNYLAEDLFDLAQAHINLAKDLLLEDAYPLLDQLQESLEKARRCALQAGWHDLLRIAVHGDYNPWNLLFNEEYEVCAILDFDNAGIDARLHDIAECLLTHCVLHYRGNSTNFAPIIPDRVPLQGVRDILCMYEAISPLSSIEHACLPWTILAVFIELSCLGLIRGDFCLNHIPAMIDWIEELIRIDRDGFIHTI